MYKLWNNKEIEFIKENYKNMTNKAIAEKLGRTKTAVDIKINKLGLKKGKYFYDVDYFKEINSIDKAYWLGFIYADGYISVSQVGYGKEFAIELQDTDYKHLKKFNKSINGNIEVKRFKRKCNLNQKVYNSCSIRIYSKEFVDNLISQGITSDKSSNVKLPVLEDKYMSHFIRGYFDGDGCITSYKASGYDRYKTSFIGTYNFLQSINDIINNKYNIYIPTLHKRKAEHEVYSLEYSSCKRSKILYEYMYNEATIYLNRKHKKYSRLMKKNNS